MTQQSRLAACLPYAACLALAAVLWALTGQITYDERPGQLGPAFWPRVAIAVMALAAVAEIVRRLLTPRLDEGISGIGEALEAGGDDGEAEEPRSAAQLLGAVLLTVGYGFVVTTFGFILSTFLFLVAFMYLGRYRNHLVVWASAAIGTLVFAFVFLKIVYISLPRGTAPFDGFTQAVLDLFGRI